MPDRPLRVALWCAVSTKPQAEKISLQEQERLGREFAALHNAEVVAVFSVPGHTRDYVEFTEAEQEIPAYSDLRDAIRRGAFDVLWCYDEDRLGRTAALILQVVGLVERKSAREVFVHSSPHQVGAKGDGHGTLTGVKASLAEQEIVKFRARHRMGMIGRVRDDGLIPGTLPFWLTATRDPSSGAVVRYEFTPEAAALDLMTDLFLAGHTYSEIWRRLNQSPWPAPTGGAWPYPTIRQTLLSDVPAGLPAWGGHRAAEPGPVPARWDAVTFAAVVRERQRRSCAPYVRRGGGPLTGVAVCGRCGEFMTRSIHTGTGRPQLRCKTHCRRQKTNPDRCHPNCVAEIIPLAAIAGYLDRLASDPAEIDAALAALARDDGGTVALRLADAEAQVTDLLEQQRRLAVAYRTGRMTIDVYAEQAADVDRLLLAARERVTDLRRAADAAPDLEQQRVILENLAEAFALLAEHGEPAEVAAMLQGAGLVVVVECRAVVYVGPRAGWRRTT